LLEAYLHPASRGGAPPGVSSVHRTAWSPASAGCLSRHVTFHTDTMEHFNLRRVIYPSTRYIGGHSARGVKFIAFAEQIVALHGSGDCRGPAAAARHPARRGAKKGARDPAGEASEVSTRAGCTVGPGLPRPGRTRSTAHYRRRHLRLVANGQIGDRPGPVGTVGDDDDLVCLIRQVIKDSPFAGEGLPQDPGSAAPRPRGPRVWQAGAALLRREGLLTPQRTPRRRNRLPCLPRRAGDQRLRRTVDQDPQGAEPRKVHQTGEAGPTTSPRHTSERLSHRDSCTPWLMQGLPPSPT